MVGIDVRGTVLGASRDGDTNTTRCICIEPCAIGRYILCIKQQFIVRGEGRMGNRTRSLRSHVGRSDRRPILTTLLGALVFKGTFCFHC